MKRGTNNDMAFAVGYLALGIMLIILAGLESAWAVLLAFGLWGLALIEFMGGEDSDRNYLFLIAFAVLPFGILFVSAYQYWVLISIFLFWGAYEIVEERKIQAGRMDLVGLVSIIIGLALMFTGLLGHTYSAILGIGFGLLFCIQGLKEWYD